MILSLSVRVAESFASKETSSLSLAELLPLAAASGYSAICLRASQVGVHSDSKSVGTAAALIRQHGLSVSMVTGDFNIVYNNDAGPDCLRRIQPYLALALAMRAPMVRVALKTQEDIGWAQQAADAAAKHGLTLVHQCHTQSLFETVEGIEQTLRAINRPNFGLVYEPANLELCGQDYRLPTIRRLAPWIFNVYVQNQRLKPDGQMTLPTWCCGPVSFELLPLAQPGGIDFQAVFAGLAAIDYRGPLTVHQARLQTESVSEAIHNTATYLRELTDVQRS